MVEEMNEFIKQMKREIHEAQRHNSSRSKQKRTAKPNDLGKPRRDKEPLHKPSDKFREGLRICKTTAVVKVEGNRLIVACNQLPTITEGPYRVKIMWRRGKVKIHLATISSRITQTGR